MTMTTKLEKFLADAQPRLQSTRWLCVRDMEVYVRKSRRLLDGKWYVCLDLANIMVLPAKRGQGRFTSFLETALRINPWQATYVENVLEERFRSFFRRRGWTEVPHGEGPPSFYLLTEHQ